MTTLRHIRETICLGHFSVSLVIKSAYCHIPIARRHCSFLHFKWKNTIYQFRTLPFSLSTVLKTFTGVMRPISPHCQKMGITLFLFLNKALILADSYEQARINGQRVASLLHKVVFVLAMTSANWKQHKCSLTWGSYATPGR